MSLDERPITLIISGEPELQRTSANNPGSISSKPTKMDTRRSYIGMKAMSQGLCDWPVGITHTQFECPRTNREAYWSLHCRASGR